MSNIAILCSGGDVSGMNPALKRFVEYAYEKGLQPYFIYNGFEGLIDNKIVKATYKEVSGIITKGGTKIGSARSLRFKEAKYRQIAKENLDALAIKKLIVLGGDGSFRGLEIFYKEHAIEFCGIPSTIDNDITGTAYCLGVDTALNIIKSATDAIRDTASSFSRAFIIETMGRNCGYLALITAITSGAELCIIPEVQCNLEKIKQKMQAELKNGRNYIIVIVSEGIERSSQEVANWFEEELHIESRVTALGHVQRGGNPSSHDRFMAYQFVTHAVDALLLNNNHSIVCYNNAHFSLKPIDEVALIQHKLDWKLIELAHGVLG